MAFQTQMRIHFDEADPAGVAFSAGLLTKIHRCFEDFISGFGPQNYFFSESLAYPIRHMEAEYLQPLRPLETYPVSVAVERMGQTSFTLVYEVGSPRAVVARSTHVCCERPEFKKKPLPKPLTEYLKNYLMTQ